MEWVGIAMLLAVGVGLILTGLPAFMVLIGVAGIAACYGLAAGAIGAATLQALPLRIVGLLEHDLLQALPLFVLMGALVNRLPLADILFRAGDRLIRGTAAAPSIAAMALGALMAPMNGSVGAGVATLSRVLAPKLAERGMAPAPSLATVCAASTLGVVIPPSLVLILLGDAMMRAHTEAVNKTHAAVRIINTQDVFRGALMPAAILFVLWLATAWWTARRAAPANRPAPRAALRPGEWAMAAGTLAFIVLLLAGVTVGYFYAVEAAAMGAFALFLLGWASGALGWKLLLAVLRDAAHVAGALFALLVGATTFTMIFRGFASDRLLDGLIGGLPGGMPALLAVLGMLALCAFVLDAFEIIFVVVPVVMPPLLTRVPDATFVAATTLLVLQASFLMPPVGYAVMMARTSMAKGLPTGPIARALAPYLLMQLLVLASTLSFPALVHIAEPRSARDSGLAVPASDAEIQNRLDQNLPPPVINVPLPGSQ